MLPLVSLLRNKYGDLLVAFEGQKDEFIDGNSFSWYYEKLKMKIVIQKSLCQGIQYLLIF